ncbi:MAG: tetratricopeptide repeat protein [Acidobacteriota bacterium]
MHRAFLYSALTLCGLLVTPGLLAGQSSANAAAQIARSTAPVQSIPAPTATTPAIQITPEELGDALMIHQRYQAAIDAYKQAPLNTAQIWNKMGVAYQLMFNNHDAERCYRKALKLDPKDAKVLNNLGAVYMGFRLYGSAERTYRKAIRFSPQSALFHKNLGTAYLAEGKYKKGWREYESAQALDTSIFSHPAGMRIDNPATLRDRGAMNFYMAKSCAHAGLFAQAVEYLRMALNEGFTNPKKILADAELSRMRNVPAFQQLMASQGVYLTPLTAHPPVQQ